MWQPNAGQWFVMAGAASVLTVMAVLRDSAAALTAVVVLDAGLMVWGIEVRRRARTTVTPTLVQPEAAPFVGSAASPVLRRRSVALMIVFTIATFGLYYPIWFLRRRAALNSLNSPRKIQLWPFVIFIVLVGIQVIVGIASGSEPPERTIGTVPATLLSLSQLILGIVIVVQCFVIKDIVEDHLMGPEDYVPSSLLTDRVQLSGLMTFFFQIFYLQYVINRYIAGPRDHIPANTRLQPTAAARS